MFLDTVYSQSQYEMIERFSLPVSTYMIDETPSLNLKADVAIELLPSGLAPSPWYADSPVRHHDLGRIPGDLKDVKPYFDEAEVLYAGICEKFAAVPLEEMKKENASNDEFSIASTIIKNELRTEAHQIPTDQVDDIANKFSSNARRRAKLDR